MIILLSKRIKFVTIRIDKLLELEKKLSLNKTKAEFIGMIKLSKEGCKILKNNLNFIPKKKFIKCKFTNI